jgi:hypothetical protein
LEGAFPFFDVNKVYHWKCGVSRNLSDWENAFTVMVYGGGGSRTPWRQIKSMSYAWADKGLTKAGYFIDAPFRQLDRKFFVAIL